MFGSGKRSDLKNQCKLHLICFILSAILYFLELLHKPFLSNGIHALCCSFVSGSEEFCFDLKTITWKAKWKPFSFVFYVFSLFAFVSCVFEEQQCPGIPLQHRAVKNALGPPRVISSPPQGLPLNGTHRGAKFITCIFFLPTKHNPAAVKCTVL